MTVEVFRIAAVPGTGEQDGKLWVECWCRRRYVQIKVQDVFERRTGQCGEPLCRWLEDVDDRERKRQQERQVGKRFSRPKKQ